LLQLQDGSTWYSSWASQRLTPCSQPDRRTFSFVVTSTRHVKSSALATIHPCSKIIMFMRDIPFALQQPKTGFVQGDSVCVHRSESA
jgi:hypothetical protein